MAHFYVSTENSRGNPVTASGTKKGQRSHARGWSASVEVISGISSTADAGDFFEVYMTPGSNGGGHKRHLGTVVVRDGVPTWVAHQ
jgi:hypothetical protein